jgi:hypothetical protein
MSRSQMGNEPDMCRFFSVVSRGVFYSPVGMTRYRGKFSRFTCHSNNPF